MGTNGFPQSNGRSGESIAQRSLVHRPHLSEHGAAARGADDIGAAAILGRGFTSDRSVALDPVKKARQAVRLSVTCVVRTDRPFTGVRGLR